MINIGARDSGLGTLESFALPALQTVLTKALSFECCRRLLIRDEIELAGAP
jgi:hypothetical protein